MVIFLRSEIFLFQPENHGESISNYGTGLSFVMRNVVIYFLSNSLDLYKFLISVDYKFNEMRCS